MIEQFVQLSPETEFYLRFFIITAAILAIPLAIAFCMVCLKTFLLIHNMTEFLQVIRMELTPVLKDIRNIAESLEDVVAQTNGNLQKLRIMASNMVNSVGPQLGNMGYRFLDTLQDLFGKRSKSKSASCDQTASSNTTTNVETAF